MITEILLALLQSATEFLPISSSGHLALLTNIIPGTQPNLFYFTILHLASLLAVLIYTRKEIKLLLTFNKKARKLWTLLIIASIPAAITGILLHNTISTAFNSYLTLSTGFFITGTILLTTKKTRHNKEQHKLDKKRGLFIGLLQTLALFPGISRSGMTISAGMISGIKKEQATKFSFLLFIPLSIGAVILELGTGNAYINTTLIIAFITTFITSILFLQALTIIINKNKLWTFSIYCYLLTLISILLHLTTT